MYSQMFHRIDFLRSSSSTACSSGPSIFTTKPPSLRAFISTDIFSLDEKRLIFTGNFNTVCIGISIRELGSYIICNDRGLWSAVHVIHLQSDGAEGLADVVRMQSLCISAYGGLIHNFVCSSVGVSHIRNNCGIEVSVIESIPKTVTLNLSRNDSTICASVVKLITSQNRKCDPRIK